MGNEPAVVLDGCSFLESPRWRSGRLWLSDFYAHTVLSVDGDGGDARVEVEMPGQPSGLGWLPDGRLLVVSMRDRRVLRREPDGSLVTHADLAHLATGHLNDMVVDAVGRAYVGNFGFDFVRGATVRTAALIRVDPDGAVAVAAEDLSFPNGAVLLGSTLVLAETLGNALLAFDVGADGALSGRRDWARFGPAPSATGVGEVVRSVAVAPDGIAADAEGAIWVADSRNNRAIRVREGGEIVQEVSTGSTGVYACALGGDDGRTLFLCCAPGFVEEERSTTREATLRALRVEVGAWPGAA